MRTHHARTASTSCRPLLREDAAHGIEALQAGLEFLLFHPHLAHHVFDHAFVLAAQFGHFAELFAQAGEARLEQAAHARVDVGEFGLGAFAHDVLLGGDQLPGQGRLEDGQAATLEQGVVAVDLCNQTFLRRNRENLALRQVEYRCAGVDLAIYLGIDFRQCLQFVPLTVDLVHHHHPPAAGGAAGADVFLPDRQIGLGDAGIGRQNEQNGMGIRQQRQG